MKMSSLFNFITKKENNDDNLIKEQNNKNGIFYYIKGIYDIIKNGSDNTDNDLDYLFADMDDNEWHFVAWTLNHYLVYNEFCRKNIEMFAVTSYWLKPKEYIYFYVKFMSDNKVKFPSYMQWYKLNIDGGDTKYNNMLKEKYELTDEEIENLISYMRDNISLKDICINLEYIV